MLSSPLRALSVKNSSLGRLHGCGPRLSKTLDTERREGAYEVHSRFGELLLLQVSVFEL